MRPVLDFDESRFRDGNLGRFLLAYLNWGSSQCGQMSGRSLDTLLG
jgi:hypothetical protein